MIEAGAITCVKLCKAATYINVLDSNNVIFSLVQTVINNLKNLLLKVEKPFSRGGPYLEEDVNLMIDMKWTLDLNVAFVSLKMNLKLRFMST